MEVGSRDHLSLVEGVLLGPRRSEVLFRAIACVGVAADAVECQVWQECSCCWQSQWVATTNNRFQCY